MFEVFAFIQISFGFCASFMCASRILSFFVGFCIQFRFSSSSGSSTMVGFDSMAIRARVLARRSEVCFPWCFLRSCVNPGYWFRQSNLPVFQSMSGFCSFSHGKPSMIFCFPNPVTNRRVLVVLPWIVKFMSVKQVILPCLFSVPSTFQAVIGCSSG